jgi:hypothetical protein
VFREPAPRLALFKVLISARPAVSAVQLPSTQHRTQGMEGVQTAGKPLLDSVEVAVETPLAGVPRGDEVASSSHKQVDRTENKRINEDTRLYRNLYNCIKPIQQLQCCSTCRPAIQPLLKLEPRKRWNHQISATTSRETADSLGKLVDDCFRHNLMGC